MKLAKVKKSGRSVLLKKYKKKLTRVQINVTDGKMHEKTLPIWHL